MKTVVLDNYELVLGEDGLSAPVVLVTLPTTAVEGEPDEETVFTLEEGRHEEALTLTGRIQGEIVELVLPLRNSNPEAIEALRSKPIKAVLVGLDHEGGTAWANEILDFGQDT